MAKYRVRLIKTVHDILEAFVEVEADNSAHAASIAWTEVTTEESPVQFEWYDSLDDNGDVEVDGIEEIQE
jgi:hypothetical protein